MRSISRKAKIRDHMIRRAKWIKRQQEYIKQYTTPGKLRKEIDTWTTWDDPELDREDIDKDLTDDDYENFLEGVEEEMARATAQGKEVLKEPQN